METMYILNKTIVGINIEWFWNGWCINAWSTLCIAAGTGMYSVDFKVGAVVTIYEK